jgi:hypothetical protein
LRHDLLSRLLHCDNNGVPPAEVIVILNSYFETSGITLDIVKISTLQPSGPPKVVKKLEVKFDPSPPDVSGDEDDSSDDDAQKEDWTASAISFITLVRASAKVTMNERISALRKIAKYFMNLEPSPPPLPAPPPNLQVGTRFDKDSYANLIEGMKSNWENKDETESIVGAFYCLHKQLLENAEDGESGKRAKSIRDFLLTVPMPNVFTRIDHLHLHPQPPTPLMPLASMMTAITILVYEPKSAENTWGNCKSKLDSSTYVLSSVRNANHSQHRTRIY